MLSRQLSTTVIVACDGAVITGATADQNEGHASLCDVMQKLIAGGGVCITNDEAINPARQRHLT
ncbi:hypothetical protein D3C85_1698360 [compost metagenome]